MVGKRYILMDISAIECPGMANRDAGGPPCAIDIAAMPFNIEIEGEVPLRA